MTTMTRIVMALAALAGSARAAAAAEVPAGWQAPPAAHAPGSEAPATPTTEVWTQPTVSHAWPEGYAPERRWGATAVRLDLSGEMEGGSLSGLEVSHRFGPVFGLDVAAGQSSFGYSHDGYGGNVLGRLYLFSDSSGGVSLAAGPSLRTANEFGAVGFIQSELAVEYRPRGGFSILVGAGTSVALNDSGTSHCPVEPSDWFGCWFLPTQIHRGDQTVNFRLALGASF
jgi:hypothetical protein